MSNRSAPKGKKQRDRQQQDVTPAARRKQLIVGVVMGAVMGVILGALTTFWLWLPAGIAFGLAVGAIMKPPSDS
jgi:hypothetical protein